jgi:subfamily B ATP-binding cassette protein MsbA
MSEFHRLFRFVKPHASKLIISLLLLVFAGIFEVLTTALAIPMFDDVLDLGKNSVSSVASKIEFLRRYLALLPGSVITQLSFALVILTLLKGLCLYHSNFLMSYVGQAVVMDLRKDLYRHVLNQSMAFFSLNSTGRLMSRLSGDVEQVQEAVSTTLAELFREVVLLIALVMWIFYIDWRLASISLMIAPAALGLTLTMGKRIRRASLKSRESIATQNDLLQQVITGIRIVKAFGTEGKESDRFHKAATQLFHTNLRAARILFINSPAMELLGVLSFIPLLFYAHLRISAGTLTLGTFGGSLFSLFRMYDPIRKLSRIHVQFQRAFASAARIMEVFDNHCEIPDRPGAIELSGVPAAIEFRDVSFNYRDASGEAKVLKYIRLQVRSKQVVAIVGSSGAGKSTMVSLIPRFYDVSSGAILVDGIDLREFTQSSLRRNIAIVTQETFLFNDTIRNNIAYGTAAASEEEIFRAAKAAFAHDFIMRFPMKYETLIGERGQRLSGGERQRISIARAILKNAPLLILDEATSSLDTESEKLVQQALANLMKDRTTFVIAHRLSTIRNADMIVVLDHGMICEVGNHEELLSQGRLYSHFHRLQTESASESDPSPYVT